MPEIVDPIAQAGAIIVKGGVDYGFLIDGLQALVQIGNYNVVCDPTGRAAILMGNNSDAATYYDNDFHRFRRRDGASLLADIQPDGLHLFAGSYRLGNAAVLTQADATAGRVLIGDGVVTNTALRIISESVDVLSVDVVLGNSSAAEKTLALQSNGGTLTIGSATVNLAAAATLVSSGVNAARFDNDLTAGNTRFFVGIGGGIGLIRLQVGASGSGGGGTRRLLYVDYGA